MRCAIRFSLLGDVCGDAGDASFDGFTEHYGNCDAISLFARMVLEDLNGTFMRGCTC